jgi:hypothetical protein
MIGRRAAFSKKGALGRDTVEQLGIAIACYLFIGFVVLWGSRYFGPKEH